MSEFPKMLYRAGDMLPDIGCDYRIVADEAEESAAIADGWRVGLDPLDHDGDGKPGGAKRGRKPKGEG
ncbi:hypothetical protein SAMN05660666_02504 [Novosphingobium aromaticivorans]|uniref:hypothetical protein n=1 Tax=Novosphingobium aromaticivorans TaxID=48935 RepID=UPI0002DD2484|nr:hypothetical protein [Novosphingobium aromaticivorans]SCY69297.1 hypothetical protein SAMN05660666_02504 [Novosphingobium aromaticivorans]